MRRRPCSSSKVAAFLALASCAFAACQARAASVHLTLPAPEKASLGWYEATVVNDSASPVTVTHVRFDFASDPDWDLTTTSAVPATTWADSGNDLLWTGSQVIPAYSGFTFKVQADHNFGSYTSVSMKATATVEGAAVDSQTWNARFLKDNDSALELSWDLPDEGTHDVRDGEHPYVEVDAGGSALAANTAYTFRLHVWEHGGVQTATTGTTELTVTIPAGSGWTGVASAGAGVGFGAASVSGSEPTGWTLTWDLTSQLQSSDAEALFTATSPASPSTPALVPFEATFTGESNLGDSPNLAAEYVARIAALDGTLTVSSSGGPEPTGLLRGSSDKVLDRLTLSASSGDVEITRLDFTLTGTASASDLDALELYTDADSDGSISGETLVGTFSVDGAHPEYSLTGLSERIFTEQSADYLIVADIATGATVGATLGTNVVDTDVTVSGAASVSAFDVSSETFTVGSVRVLLGLPSLEKGSDGWWRATVVNEAGAPITVTEVRFDMPSDPDWTLNTTDAVPATTWADSLNDIVWTGSQEIDAYGAFSFKIQANHNLGSHTVMSIKATATVGGVTADSQAWDARFLEDNDNNLEITWDLPDEGTNDTRDGDFSYTERDVASVLLDESTAYTFRIHVWEFKNKATRTTGTTELTVTIPASSGWTGVASVGAGVSFSAATVSGSEAAGWTITWDLTTQLQQTDGEALFTATSPADPSGPSLVPFQAVFDGQTEKYQDPNVLCEFVARVEDLGGSLSVSSPDGPAAASVNRDTTDNVIERLRLTAGDGDVEVSRIDLRLEGTTVGTDLTAVRLYTDADEDGSVSGEALVGTFTVDGAHPEYQLAGLSERVLNGRWTDYLVTVDVSPDATAEATFETNVVTSDFTVDGGSSVDTLDLSSETFTISGSRVLITIPAVEKGSHGWFEATVVNDTDTTMTVTEVRFDFPSDPDWTLQTTSAVPGSTWTDDGNDLLWTGSQTVAPYEAFTFKVQARHNLGSYASMSMNVSATVDGAVLGSRAWDCKLLDDNDNALEISWDRPDEGSNDTRDGDHAYVEEDVLSEPLAEATAYTFRLHVWEFRDVLTATTGSTELTVTIPPASGWTGVASAGAGVSFSAASVSGSEAAGWTITWDLTTQLQNTDAEATFTATSPSNPSVAALTRFEAVFSGTTIEGQDPNVLSEALVRVADSAGTLSVTSPGDSIDGNVFASSTDNVIERLRLAASGADVDVTGLGLTLEGTAAEGDLDSFELWTDTDSDGLLAGETLVGTFAIDGSYPEYTLTGLSERIFAAQSSDYLVVANMSAGAETDVTFNTNVVETDVTTVGGATVDSFDLSSATFTVVSAELLLVIPAVEKDSYGWYEATLVNEAGTPMTVTEVRFDMPSDPDWRLDTTSAEPRTSWTDDLHDLVWTGTVTVPAYSGHAFKVQAGHHLGSYTSMAMTATAVVDGFNVTSRSWDAKFLDDNDSNLELSWGLPGAGTSDVREGDHAYVEVDESGARIEEGSTYTFRLHVWEFRDKITKTTGTTELTVTIPAGSGWTGVSAAGAGVNFAEAVVTGSEVAGWTITWDLTTQLKSSDGEALFQATSPTGLSKPALVPFEAVFTGETEKQEDPNLLAELVARVGPLGGTLTVTSPAGPASASIGRGEQDRVIERLRLAASGGDVDVQVSGLGLTLLGSVLSSDLSAIELWTDEDDDGSIAGEALVATFAVDGAHPEYVTGDLDVFIPMAQDDDFLIAVDVAESAVTGNSFSTDLDDGDVTVDPSSSVQTFVITSPWFYIREPLAIRLSWPALEKGSFGWYEATVVNGQSEAIEVSELRFDLPSDPDWTLQTTNALPSSGWSDSGNDLYWTGSETVPAFSAKTFKVEAKHDLGDHTVMSGVVSAVVDDEAVESESWPVRFLEDNDNNLEISWDEPDALSHDVRDGDIMYVEADASANQLVRGTTYTFRLHVWEHKNKATKTTGTAELTVTIPPRSGWTEVASAGLGINFDAAVVSGSEADGWTVKWNLNTQLQSTDGEALFSARAPIGHVRPRLVAFRAVFDGETQKVQDPNVVTEYVAKVEGRRVMIIE